VARSAARALASGVARFARRVASQSVSEHRAPAHGNPYTSQLVARSAGESP
jgi:hypothetical protein